jgi:probable HAF family extracellular repeat protein
MRSKLSSCIMAIAAIFALMSVALANGQQPKQPPRYYVINLGEPGGGNNAGASSINNVGWIAGLAVQSGNANMNAELWVGIPINLGTLGGPNSAVAWPNKNNHGQIAGIAETADMNPLNEEWSCAQANFYPFVTGHVCLGFLWEDGVMTALSPLAGGIDSYAAGINDEGEVVGWAENGIHDPTCNSTPPVNQILQFEAVVWGPKLGEMTRLSPLSSDPDSAATAINDRGQIVGISGLCANAAGSTSAEHAVLWQNRYAPPIDLGNFDGGLAWNTPTAVNNRAQVVGFGNQQGSPATAFNPIAFYWDREHGIEPVNPLSGDTNDWAWGINVHGQVVGQSFNVNTGAQRAFLYENGQLTDLNSLVQSNSSLQLLLANDINDQGEIAGFATDTTTGVNVAFLAVPANDGNQYSVRSAGSNLRDQAVPDTRRGPSSGTFSRFAATSTTSK